MVIPDLPRIVAFRNVLIHGYATVDDRLVWGVVEANLPRLLALLIRMLDAAGDAKPESLGRALNPGDGLPEL